MGYIKQNHDSGGVEYKALSLWLCLSICDLSEVVFSVLVFLQICDPPTGGSAVKTLNKITATDYFIYSFGITNKT
ncbi:hypothetical protein SDC9_66672 [bioreactor metagenome]|uniref:Uncharacterized protein n=1 Tax=bioreactor metagenome TaxID=1076179 RepID=A0A644Y132_9ZZZZ